MKKIVYFLQAILLYVALTFFRCLSPDSASSLGGWVGRSIGPRLAASRKVIANLQRAFPEKQQEEIRAILTGMWDNLGRVMAEYPHLMTIIQTRCEVVGEHHLDNIGINNRCIIVGAHLANWELMHCYFNYKKNWPVACIYRAPNNPYIEKFLKPCRNPEDRGRFIPKSTKGARRMIKSLQDNERLGILIDQKYNQGIVAPFLGHPAMTSPAFAQLAEKFDCPMIPIQVQRLGSCHFRLTLHPPIKTEGRPDLDIIAQMHGLIEEWIKLNPSQWLWLHRRWGSKILENFQ